MKSNDNVPEDEMILAELLATAKAEGLSGCQGAMFADIRGCRVRVTNSKKNRKTPQDAVSCCALGAAWLAGIKLSDWTARGNDCSRSGLMPGLSLDHPILTSAKAADHWNIGAAFDLAMQGE